jgi:hypothetical protein
MKFRLRPALGSGGSSDPSHWPRDSGCQTNSGICRRSNPHSIEQLALLRLNVTSNPMLWTFFSFGVSPQPAGQYVESRSRLLPGVRTRRNWIN